MMASRLGPYEPDWSPWLDVKILLLTVVTVFKGFAK
jgi:lipopolysaccharide/colanic/teichoic acid biosynthesis glycosyltransferase